MSWKETGSDSFSSSRFHLFPCSLLLPRLSSFFLLLPVWHVPRYSGQLHSELTKWRWLPCHGIKWNEMALEKRPQCVLVCLFGHSIVCLVVLTVYDIYLPQRLLVPSQSSWHLGVICHNRGRPPTAPHLPVTPTFTGSLSGISPCIPAHPSHVHWKDGNGQGARFLSLPAADGRRFGKQRRPSRTAKPILLSFETNL